MNLSSFCHGHAPFRPPNKDQFSGNRSNLASVLPRTYWCSSQPLLCTDLLWQINNWESLTLKGLFCLSWAYDHSNNSQRDQPLKKRKGFLEGSLPKRQICQRWNIYFGTNKMVSGSGRKLINPVANPFVCI